jgi:hypothetical protein
MFFRCALICLGAAAFCGATDINFDNINASGGNVAVTNQYSGVTFGTDSSGSDGCTNVSGCGFSIMDEANLTGAGVITNSSPNFVGATGNVGTSLTITFSGPVTLDSIDLLGLAANSTGFYDGASITLWDGGTQIGSPYVISAQGPNSSSSAINPTAYNFNVSNVTSVVLTKTANSSGPGIFGFDDLTYVTSGVPEPASFLLIGCGMTALFFVRRLRTSQR